MDFKVDYKLVDRDRRPWTTSYRRMSVIQIRQWIHVQGLRHMLHQRMMYQVNIAQQLEL